MLYEVITISIRQILPAGSSAKHPQDALKHLAIVYRRAATS